MKIDAHQHFWKYSPETHGWIDDSMSVLKKDYLPTDLLPELKKSGYDGCVAVQAAQTEEESFFLLQLSDEYDFVKGVVGWVDLQAEDVSDRLAYFADHPKFCGIRHIVQSEPDDRFLLRPAFMRGIKALAEFDLTYDILTFVKQLPAAIEFAGKFPDQPFVVDHISKPEIKDGKLKPWKKHIQQLAEREHVYCKLSGLVTEADWQNWEPADFAPYLDIVMEAFGPGRLMIGSDWPVCRLAGEHTAVMQLVENHISQLSDDERAAILGRNAAKFYGLG